jgi:hypothetical protein
VVVVQAEFGNSKFLRPSLVVYVNGERTPKSLCEAIHPLPPIFSLFPASKYHFLIPPINVATLGSIPQNKLRASLGSIILYKVPGCLERSERLTDPWLIYKDNECEG